MLVVDVELLHGTLRAGSAGDTAITGQVDPGEWPPSPVRLLAAFVAADGTRDRCRVTDGAELALFTHAAPPDIVADRPDQVAHTPLRERFVVGDARDTGVAQDYPARKATMVRPGSVLSPRHPRLTYVYRDITPSPLELAALQLRAARIGYVGAADQPARVRVCSVETHQLPEDRTWHPDPDGSQVLGVPDDGLLDRLDHAFDRFSSGEPVRRSWLATASARYRAPGEAEPTAPPTLVWLRLQQSLPAERLLDLTETLRAAVLSHLGDDAPAELHGHGMSDSTDEGWLQARYMAFPDVGHRYADGRLHGVAVWLPPDVEATTTASVRRALTAITQLHRPGGFATPVTPHDGRTGIRTTQTRRWTGPSRRWVTATPVVFQRHGAAHLDEVRRWFAHVGLPAPSTAELLPTPVVEGAVQLRPHHLRRRYSTRFAHLDVTFDTPLHGGPFIVGRGRQFGLGLLVPYGHGNQEQS